GVAEPLTWISTATKHLIRGYILRSCPQFGVKMSGSKGGGSGAGTTATAAITGLILAGMLSGLGAELGIDAAGVLFACPDLISRIASSSACSRCSGEASRYVFSSFPRWLTRSGSVSRCVQSADAGDGGFESLIREKMAPRCPSASLVKLAVTAPAQQDDQSHPQFE